LSKENNNIAEQTTIQVGRVDKRMPILTDLCDKSCFARKFAWLGKRDATIAPVQPKVPRLHQNSPYFPPLFFLYLTAAGLDLWPTDASSHV